MKKEKIKKITEQLSKFENFLYSFDEEPGQKNKIETGLNVSRYFSRDGEKVLASIVFHKQTLNELTEIGWGHFIGYSGGGVTEDGFFNYEKKEDKVKIKLILSHEEIEEMAEKRIFDWLLCENTYYCDFFPEKDTYLFTEKAKELFDMDGELFDNGQEVFQDDEVDLSLLKPLSKKWPLTLGFS